MAAITTIFASYLNSVKVHQEISLHMHIRNGSSIYTCIFLIFIFNGSFLHRSCFLIRKCHYLAFIKHSHLHFVYVYVW